MAKFSSFSTQSELLCTQGLAYLLKAHEQARTALASEVQIRTGVHIAEALTWLPEVAQAAYEKAQNQLTTGSGNLVVRTQKLKKLGAKAKKAIPDSLVQAAELDQQALGSPEGDSTGGEQL